MPRASVGAEVRSTTPERLSQCQYCRRMDSEPSLVRVIRAFLEERDDADPESNLVARVSDLKDVRSTLTWGSWVFSARRGTKTRTVLVPEGLQDPDARGMREVVWAEAKVREMKVTMDNPGLLRIATLQPRGVVPDPKDINSRRTRVLPVFGWLRDHGEPGWPDALAAMATGLSDVPKIGAALRVHLENELKVPAGARRLRWLLANGARLTPSDGRRWRELETRTRRVASLDAVDRCLDAGVSLPPLLTLEGETSGDCVIECEDAIVWIEGKRHDWLAPHTTWDSARDQLARNLEAAWLYASTQDKDFCLLICCEDALRSHEQLLVDGYRNATWSGGWPHLDPTERAMLAERIGLVRWADIAIQWPALHELPELSDLHAHADPSQQPGT